MRRILCAAAVALAAGCGSRSSPAGQIQPLPSPDGSVILTVPILPDPDGHLSWTVTMVDSAGDTVYSDRESGFVGSLNVYWTWGEDLLWLYNSDDGRVWFYERRGGSWTKNAWGSGFLRETSRELMPPADLFPDYLGYDPDSVEQGVTIDSVVIEEGPGHRLMICHAPVAMEIPEIGDSLGRWADWNAQGFREMVGPDIAAAPEPGMPPFEFETVFSGEPSPEGLVCISARCYEYTGGAHGNSWTRSFVYSLDTGGFLVPLSLVGDSAAQARFCSSVADTLRARLGDAGIWIDGGTAPDPANYNNLLPLPDSAGGIAGFRVVFDPYRVAPYAYGEQEVIVRQ